VAYGLANVLAAIPITPSGLGAVEGALIPTLVWFHVPTATAIFGVLAYRLVNFWLPVPAGALAYLSLRATGLRRNTAPGPVPGPVPGPAPALPMGELPVPEFLAAEPPGRALVVVRQCVGCGPEVPKPERLDGLRDCKPDGLSTARALSAGFGG